MDISKDNLRKRYEGLQSEELQKLYIHGGLTETAKSILIDVLTERKDIDIENLNKKRR